MRHLYPTKTKKRKKAQKTDEDSANLQEKKEKRRFVDFWCMDSKKEFELWIETKRVWLNIGKNTNKEFDKNATEHIKDAINQIRKIKPNPTKKQKIRI